MRPAPVLGGLAVAVLLWGLASGELEFSPISALVSVLLVVAFGLLERRAQGR